MSGFINVARFWLITGASLFLANVAPSPNFLVNSFAQKQWWIPLLIKLIVIEIALLIIIPKKKRERSVSNKMGRVDAKNFGGLAG